MPTYELTLEGFHFPADLEESRSSFRFLFDFRYYDPGGGYATAHAVLPGLDTYWECEKGHKDRPNFVRPDDLSPRFDMGRVDVWDRLVIRLRATDLHSLQVKVIDVEKGGGLLDKVKEYVGPLLQSYLGVVRPQAARIIGGAPAFARGVLGDAAGDVEALALAKLAGMKGAEFLLFKGGMRREDMPAEGGDFAVEGRGHEGAYRIELRLRVEED